ncbi:MAG TPA: ABC transporter substrate-binding protein [Actinomycetes bacterium]|jgi:glycine betaine/proline transport system substrate-binding protein|nr:ABC transporter substrate-binding protein [Actinomycetes bacterium]
MKGSTRARVVAGMAALGLLLAACSGAKTETGGGGSAGGAKGTVKIAINPWVGYEANAAVVGYLLEKELGYKVENKNLKEEVSWQGFETGEVDVILENWGHDDLKKKYIEEKKVAVEVGPTGNQGIIGWYVPGWMAEQYPDITKWQSLNKYADLFKTSESSGKGQLLDGDPSFVTNDQAIVNNLSLKYKVVYSGGEAASIKTAEQAARQRKPLLFYFWEPHWIHSQEKFVKIDLPAYKTGCDADPKKVACDYPPYVLDKIASKKFADTGGKAYQLIKNFKWTNENQNEVANAMTNDKLPAEQAAKKWVDAHKDVWQAWIPTS